MTDLAKKIEQLGPWYHTIDLGNGVKTPGKSNVSYKFNLISKCLDFDLNGVTVIDVGCNAGGMSVEFAKRGARVTGIEVSKHYFKQANFVRDHLGLNIKFVNGRVYDMIDLGSFDVVLFLGIFYHFRYPMLALDMAHSICNNCIFLSTKISSEDCCSMDLVRKDRSQVMPQDEPKDNWWFPSDECTQRMMNMAGFTDVVHILVDKERQNGWYFARASCEKIAFHNIGYR